MIVVKEIRKETVRAAVRKAAQKLRKADFAPSRVLSFFAAAVVTFDSPKIPHGVGPGFNQIQIGRVCRGLDLNRKWKAGCREQQVAVDAA
jgi:hypothetical protein